MQETIISACKGLYRKYGNKNQEDLMKIVKYFKPLLIKMATSRQMLQSVNSQYLPARSKFTHNPLVRSYIVYIFLSL